MNSEVKNCQNCKIEFVIEPDDFAFYEKIKVPPPTFCPYCRAQRRFCWRNEWVLYKAPSAFSGKDIFQMYAPEVGVKVYEKEVWYSDQWDPMSYGRDYDFSRPFFAQFKDLLFEVPLKNLDVLNGVNSDYTNNLTEPKNCYLVFNGSNPEDCRYGNGINFCRDCQDMSHMSKSEECYECFWLNGCARCIFSSQCDSCFDMLFSKNCVGCNNCFGCVGLRNKSYYIWNKPYSKEEYEKIVKSFGLSSYTAVQNMKTKAKEFWLGFPNKYVEGIKNENVSGAYIDRCKNVRNSFLVRESENLRYCQYVQELPGSRDCYDYSVWGDNNQLVYECHTSGIGMHNVKFSVFAKENIRDVEYSYACTTCSDCFGCVSLRKKQYCIFNKQYTKEEYFALRDKIVAQMNDMPYTDRNGCVYRYGEFFPAEISPFPYNQTLAQEYFPIEKEEAIKRGYRWIDTGEKNYKATLLSENIPDAIADVSDAITQDIINCEHGGMCNQLCTKAFRIIPDELAFYRKHQLPVPHLCPNCRAFERLKQRNGIHLYKRQCGCGGANSADDVYKNTAAHSHGAEKCSNEFETSYAPERQEIVYCEQCYQAEVA
jgi:hypothetical protein